jgi:hypothetical protein
MRQASRERVAKRRPGENNIWAQRFSPVIRVLYTVLMVGILSSHLLIYDSWALNARLISSVLIQGLETFESAHFKLVQVRCWKSLLVQELAATMSEPGATWYCIAYSRYQHLDNPPVMRIQLMEEHQPSDCGVKTS